MENKCKWCGGITTQIDEDGSELTFCASCGAKYLH